MLDTNFCGGHVILNLNVSEDYTEYLIASYNIYAKTVMPELKIQLINWCIFANYEVN
jgi:hypothetical protein